MDPQEATVEEQMESNSSPQIEESSAEESSGFLSGLDSVLGGEESDSSSSSESESDSQEDSSSEQISQESEKPEVDPDLADLPKSVSEKTKVGWKELKNSKRQLEQERDQLKKELDSLKKQPPSQKNTDEIEATKQELERYKQQLSEYENKVALVDVTQSAEYQNNIAAPLAEAENIIQEFAQKYELNIREVAAAAMKTNVLERNAMLSEMTAGMNTYDQQEFKKVLDDARSLYIKSEQVKSNAASAYKYLQQQREQEQAKKLEDTKKQRSEAAKSTWETLSKALPKSIAGDEKLMSQLNNDILSTDILEAPPQIQAYAAQAAVMLPIFKEQLEAKDKKIAELEAAISKRSGAMPKAKSGAISAKPVESEKGFLDGLDELLG
jgi:hypothetical protein